MVTEEEHNRLIQLVAKLSKYVPFPVWIKGDPKEPTIFIALPTGQVSWRIPVNELVVSIPEDGWAYDRHSQEEREQRIRAFLEDERW